MIEHNTCFICTVCDTRWGNFREGADVELTKCEKHAKSLNSSEIYMQTGMSPKQYSHWKRLQQIRNKLS